MPVTHCMKNQTRFVCIEVTPPHFTCWPFLLVSERTVNRQSPPVSVLLTVCGALLLSHHLLPGPERPSFLNHSL